MGASLLVWFHQMLPLPCYQINHLKISKNAGHRNKILSGKSGTGIMSDRETHSKGETHWDSLGDLVTEWWYPIFIEEIPDSPKYVSCWSSDMAHDKPTTSIEVYKHPAEIILDMRVRPYYQCYIVTNIWWKSVKQHSSGSAVSLWIFEYLINHQSGFDECHIPSKKDGLIILSRMDRYEQRLAEGKLCCWLQGLARQSWSRKTVGLYVSTPVT